MTSANALAAGAGCYDAGRAAALTGVPRSTVYWWARSGVVVPSVSPTAEKLWSYNDLIALRIVSWLRHPKSGGQLPANPMPNVRQALAVLDAQGIDLWHRQRGCSLLVDRKSRIFIRSNEDIQDLYGQPTLLPAETLDLTQPFAMDGAMGPDLIRPGPWQASPILRAPDSRRRPLPRCTTADIRVARSRICISSPWPLSRPRSS